MRNKALERSCKTNSAEQQTTNSFELNKTDPWGHISGERFEGNNPWLGKYDRRKKQRDIEGWIEYNH